MIIKVILPSDYCVHDREKVREYLKSGGINVEKKIMLYRDFTTGQYIFQQETEDIIECDNRY